MRALLIVAIMLGAAHAERFEPGTEAPGAVAAGASAVADAVKLGKQPEQKWKALFAFQDIAKKWPAALHDCYLALAYLRVDEVQKARLVLDRAATRGGERPKWCTGDLEHQLAKALENYVQVVIDVTPRDAVVTIDVNVEVRNFATVWVFCPDCTRNPGTRIVNVDADAPGMAHLLVKPPLVAPVTHVVLKLEAASGQTVDSGTVATQHDTSHHDEPPPAQSPPMTSQTTTAPTPIADLPVPHLPLRSAALKLGALTGALAVIGGGVAFYFREQANGVYRTDPEFATDKDGYQSAGITAIALGGVSALCFVSAIFLSDGDHLTIAPTNSGVMMNYGARW